MRRIQERRIIGGYVEHSQSAPPAAPPAPPASNPQTIMGANCRARWKSTDMVTEATGVSNWLDLVGGVDFAQGTAANQPLYSDTGGPNDKPYITFDGSNDSLVASLVRAAPGTTPSVIWMVARQLTWTANDPLTNDAGATAHGVIRQVGASPALVIFCGGAANKASNAAAVLNTWVRIEARFNNSTSDQLKIAATVATADASSGNAAGTNPALGRNAGSTVFCNFDIAEICLFDVFPDASQDTDLDAYLNSEYLL